MTAKKKTTKKKTKRKSKKTTTAAKRPKKNTTPFEPTDDQRRQVELLKGFGIPDTETHKFVINPHTGKHISRETMRKYFQAELSSGKQKVIAKVAGALVKKALGDGNGSVAAAIFFLKARAGWREKPQELNINANTGVLVAPAAMTPQQWVDAQEKKNEGKQNPIDGDE